MAALKVLNEQPDRIILGKGGGSIGSLIGVAIFGLITCVSLIPSLDGGFNPVMLVVLIVVGLALLNSLSKTLSSTRVILDANQRIATRTETVLLVPTRRQEMAFNVIRDVQVTAPRGASEMNMGGFPIWQTELRSSDGSTLILNDHATRAEMDALAQRVGGLLNRPVRQTPENGTQTAQTATTYTPAAVMTSLYENLIAFAQSATPANVAPPFSAATPMNPTPRTPQDEMERTARGRRPRRQPASQSSPSSPTATTPENPDTTLVELNQAISSQPASVEIFDALNVSPDSFVAPPVLIMPQLPGMMTFGPALDMPSFSPLGFTMPAQAVPTFDNAEYKEVVAQVTSPEILTPTAPASQDALAQYRSARQAYSMGSFRDAQAGYLRALSANPADAALQNDLGVSFLALDQLPEAERAFRRAVALDSFSGASRYNLGMTLLRLGKRSEAFEQFRVGAQTARPEELELFRAALHGNLTRPRLSPSP